MVDGARQPNHKGSLHHIKQKQDSSDKKRAQDRLQSAAPNMASRGQEKEKEKEKEESNDEEVSRLKQEIDYWRARCTTLDQTWRKRCETEVQQKHRQRRNFYDTETQAMKEKSNKYDEALEKKICLMTQRITQLEHEITALKAQTQLAQKECQAMKINVLTLTVCCTLCMITVMVVIVVIFWDRVPMKHGKASGTCVKLIVKQ